MKPPILPVPTEMSTRSAYSARPVKSQEGAVFPGQGMDDAMNVRITMSLLAVLLAGRTLWAQEPSVVPSDPSVVNSAPAVLPALPDSPLPPNVDTSPITPPPPDSPVLAPLAPSPQSVVWDARPRVSPPGIVLDRVDSHTGFWTSVEYVMAFQHGMALPPLVTTSPAGTAQNIAGVLGQSTTSVLAGQESVNDGLRNGIHLDVGYWLPRSNNRVAVQTGFKFIGSSTYNFGATSDGTTILARPFLNFTSANNNRNDAALIAFPGVSTGSVRVSANLDSYYDFNVDLRENFYAGSSWRWDSLIGYRFLRQNDRLNVTSTAFPLGAAFIPGTQIVTTDQFEAGNDFHGVEIGLIGEWRRPRWTMEILAKIAAGQLQRRITIGGRTTTTVPGGATTDVAGGLLALSSNTLDAGITEYTAVPEFGLNAKFDVSRNAYVQIGYNFLYIPEFARAAEQIDLAINPNLIPPGTPGSTPARPQFVFQRNEMWIHALHLGFTVHY